MISEKEFKELKNGDVVQVKCVDGYWYNALVIETIFNYGISNVLAHHMGPSEYGNGPSEFGTMNIFRIDKVRKIDYVKENIKTIKTIKKLAESLEV